MQSDTDAYCNDGLQCVFDGKATVEITKHAAMYTTTAMTRADLAEGHQEGELAFVTTGGGGALSGDPTLAPPKHGVEF